MSLFCTKKGGAGGFLEVVRDAWTKKKERRDFLEVVRDVLCKCVEKHGNKNWLSVFRKRYSHHEVDSLGRIIWYVCVCVRARVCVCVNGLCVFRKRYSHHKADSLGRIIWCVCVYVCVCVCATRFRQLDFSRQVIPERYCIRYGGEEGHA